MIYYLRTMAILTLSLAMFGQSSIARVSKSEKSEVKKKYSNRRLLVRYKDETSIRKSEEVHFSVGAYVLKSYDSPEKLDLVEVTKGISLDAAQEFYREDPNVLYVEPDYEYHALMQPPPSSPPNPTHPEDPPAPSVDPKLSEQWGINNVGQAIGESAGTVDVDINAPEMWATLPGDESIIIAVIDTGINYLHPDLKDNAWINPGEIPGNGIDDDGNGVIDDIHGFNALDNTGDPMDDHGHGSHCSGIMAARGGNEHGGSGVNPKGKVIGCKFLSASGSGTASGAIDCLHYLRDLKKRSENPVNIFASSNSWGGGPASQALEDAIREHQELGILFIAAASNDSQDNDEVDTFPADYPLANIVSVAATDNQDRLADFSNYGKRTVHVGAPGVDILSTTLASDYEMMSGTSMATPFAAGLAGMIKAHNPSLNYLQVKNLLMAGGVPTNDLAGKTVSGRRIRAIDSNGLGSLTCNNQIVSGRLSPSQKRLLIPVGEAVTLSAININCAEPNGQVFVPINPLGESVALEDTGIGLDGALNDGVYTQEWVPTAAGRYEFVFPNNDIVVVNVYDPALMKSYTASTEAEFNYRKIGGKALLASDDSVNIVDTPFALKFAGGTLGFDQLTIDSNGVMSVTNQEALGFNNQALPVSSNLSVIAPFWDDLTPGGSGGDIFVETLGTAPNREFVVEWRNVRHYSSANGITFQVVFFENSSDILFNYLNVEFGRSQEDRGASATIGVQTSSDHYVSIGYNEAKLENNQGIRFTLNQ